MISKKEYKEKYNQLINNDIFKFIEQTIDENIIKDKLEDELILNARIDEETIEKILSLISDKYENNDWDNLSFKLDNITYFSNLFYYNYNNNYKIKYILS